MDRFTEHTAELVTTTLRKAGHITALEGPDGHSGFKITPAGTPGAIRLSHGMYVNPLYSDEALIKRSRPSYQLAHLGRYTLDLLPTFHLCLTSNKKTRYLLVSQRTAGEEAEVRAMKVRAALMDCHVYGGEEFHAETDKENRDVIRVTFTTSITYGTALRRAGVALDEAARLLEGQHWQVVNSARRGYLLVMEIPEGWA